MATIVQTTPIRGLPSLETLEFVLREHGSELRSWCEQVTRVERRGGTLDADEAFSAACERSLRYVLAPSGAYRTPPLEVARRARESSWLPAGGWPGRMGVAHEFSARFFLESAKLAIAAEAREERRRRERFTESAGAFACASCGAPVRHEHADCAACSKTSGRDEVQRAAIVRSEVTGVLARILADPEFARYADVPAAHELIQRLAEDTHAAAILGIDIAAAPDAVSNSDAARILHAAGLSQAGNRESFRQHHRPVLMRAAIALREALAGVYDDLGIRGVTSRLVVWLRALPALAQGLVGVSLSIITLLAAFGIVDRPGYGNIARETINRFDIHLDTHTNSTSPHARSRTPVPLVTSKPLVLLSRGGLAIAVPLPAQTSRAQIASSTEATQASATPPTGSQTAPASSSSTRGGRFGGLTIGN